MNVSIYVSGLLSAKARNAIETHLKTCRSCSQYANELSELVQNIRQMRETCSEVARSEALHARWTVALLERALVSKKHLPKKSKK
jgi:anti-sigma factor RsiW